MLHVDATVDVNSKLWDAMKAMDRSCAGVALVTDSEGRLVGTVTDGDVRRALLSGATVHDWILPFVYRNFTAVGPHVARAEVLDMMQARRIEQVPVLDDYGKLLGLHLLREMMGPVERPNWAVVMAGGIGSRLRPLTDAVPKPMLKVAGRPILERIVLHLVGHGIRRVFLSVNYLGHVIEQHFGDGSRFGCEIEYLREDRPMGTAGALSLLPPPTDPVLVLNGDLITEANVGAMLDKHEGAISVGVRAYSYQVPYGCVTVDGARVIGLEEKPRESRLINAGVYVLSPAAVRSVGGECNMTSIIEAALIGGGDVRAFELEDDWLDVGQHDQLRLARGAA